MKASRIMKVVSFIILGFTLLSAVNLNAASDREVVPVWPETAPGSESKTGNENVRITEAGEHVVTSVHRPTLTIFLPKGGKAAAAVVVIPGGGHRELWVDHEGYNVAERLAEKGLAAFVLKYRLAREPDSTYRVDHESLQDVRRAIRLVRARAKEWNVDPARVGVMGFSAGGELAALAASHAGDELADWPDAIGQGDARPAFQALIYPGRSANIAPQADAPPAFLVCGANDRPDISEGLARVYLRFKEARVPAELHIYAHAAHGFGVRSRNRSAAAGWLDRFNEWMRDSGFVDAQ